MSQYGDLAAVHLGSRTLAVAECDDSDAARNGSVRRKFCVRLSGNRRETDEPNYQAPSSGPPGIPSQLHRYDPVARSAANGKVLWAVFR